MKDTTIPCCLCGGVSLRLVGRKGYCKAHVEQAFAAAKREVFMSNGRITRDQLVALTKCKSVPISHLDRTFHNI